MPHDLLADLGIEEVAEPVIEEVAEVEGSVLRLDASLTIGDVGEFYEVCHRALDNTGPLEIIGACIKEAIEQGREVQWQSTSEALIRAARVMGLDESLGLDQAAQT